MSYPPPPGLKPSVQHPPANLPARPPPSAVGSSSFKPGNVAVTSRPAFAAFAPRAVASSASARTNAHTQYVSQPIPTYNALPAYAQASQPYGHHQPLDQYQQGAPQIHNPFVPTSASSNAGYGAPPGYDPEYEAQIQQWQSAYMGKEEHKPGMTAKSVPTISAPVANTSSGTSTPNPESAAQKTVKRTGGGTEWTDSSLLEWDPAHFRLFIGNLAGEVTDESLLKAFARYPSVQKARVIRDKRTTKSKGFGFVSFSNGDDYFSAAKEMNGKYIGSHPVTITKAKTEVRPTSIRNDRDKHKKKGSGGHYKVEHGGVSKKIPKTKGGLKVLG